MTEQTYRNVALRVAYDSADDTYDLEFPTWRRTLLDYTEAGRLLAGEGAHPTTTRGILACAVDTAPDRVLVSFVPGSESFVTSPAVDTSEHDVTFSRGGFVIVGTYAKAQRVAEEFGLRSHEYSVATSERHLHGRSNFHYVATHDAPHTLVMLAERLGGTGLSSPQVLRARLAQQSDTELHGTEMPPVRDMAEVFPVLAYFTYEHLPEHLQKVSRPLCMMAQEIAKMYADGADERELAKALDRLLEAKDAAVRAAVKP